MDDTDKDKGCIYVCVTSIDVFQYERYLKQEYGALLTSADDSALRLPLYWNRWNQLEGQGLGHGMRFSWQ